MGWHRLAYTSDVCLEVAHKMAADQKLPQDVRDEARRCELRIAN